MLFVLALHNVACPCLIQCTPSQHFGRHLCGGTQGLAEYHADEAAGRAIQRQDVFAKLQKTVQHRQDSTAQQIAAHQALVDRQASSCNCYPTASICFSQFPVSTFNTRVTNMSSALVPISSIATGGQANQQRHCLFRRVWIRKTCA